MLPMRPWHSGYDMNSRRGRDNPTPLPHSAPLPRSNSQIGEIVVAEQPALFACSSCQFGIHTYQWVVRLLDRSQNLPIPPKFRLCRGIGVMVHTNLDTNERGRAWATFVSRYWWGRPSPISTQTKFGRGMGGGAVDRGEVGWGGGYGVVVG